MGMVTVSVRCLGCRAVLASRDSPDTRRDSPSFAEDHRGSPFGGAYFFCSSPQVLKSGGALCANCTHREAEVYMEKLRHLSACEKRCWRIMAQCQL